MKLAYPAMNALPFLVNSSPSLDGAIGQQSTLGCLKLLAVFRDQQAERAMLRQACLCKRSDRTLGWQRCKLVTAYEALTRS